MGWWVDLSAEGALFRLVSVQGTGKLRALIVPTTAPRAALGSRLGDVFTWRVDLSGYLAQRSVAWNELRSLLPAAKLVQSSHQLAVLTVDAQAPAVLRVGETFAAQGRTWVLESAAESRLGMDVVIRDHETGRLQFFHSRGALERFSGRMFDERETVEVAETVALATEQGNDVDVAVKESGDGGGLGVPDPAAAGRTGDGERGDRNASHDEPVAGGDAGAADSGTPPADDERRDAGDTGPAIPAAGTGADDGDGEPERGGGRRGPSARPRLADADDGIDRRVTQAVESILESARDWAENDYAIKADLDNRTPLERARDNVAAIELLKQLESESRPPTEDEKDVLTRFSGWGDSTLANTFFNDREYFGGWRELRTRARAVMSTEELNAAKLSTQYAHYTSAEVIVDGVYAALDRMGFKGVGRVLEAGAGVGRFRGLMPDEMRRRTHYTGIENDPIAGGIAKALYRSSDIRVEDFTTTHLAKNFYDVGVGNVPFSSLTIRDDPEYASLGLSLHNYFIAKVVDRLRPGGLFVCITSRYTMDATRSKARAWLAERANLVGAIRLPSSAFVKSAGTQVVADILILQKRAPGEEPSGETWSDVVDAVIDGRPSPEHPINEYFGRNPEMVLGRATTNGRGLYGRNEYSVEESGPLLVHRLRAAVARLPEGIYRPRLSTMALAEEAPKIEVVDRNRKEGRYFLHEDKLYRVIDGMGQAVSIVATEGDAAGARECLSQRKAAIMRDYVALRDARETLLQTQMAIEPGMSGWEHTLDLLGKAYDRFVAKWGPLHKTTANGSQPNLIAVSGDPEAYAVAAIERFDPQTKAVSKAPIFTERVMAQPIEPTVVSASDALAWSLNRFAHVDIAAMAEKISMPPPALLDELGEAVFEDPRTQTWVTRDEYLSGEVVTKLADAERAAREDPRRYTRNVEALVAVQPKPLTPVDITVRLGSAWVPAEYIDEFARVVVGVWSKDFSYDTTIQKWQSTYSSWDANERWRRRLNSPSNYAESRKFATARMDASEILEAVLNQASLRVMDSVKVDGKDKSVVNPVETEAANLRAAEMHEAWRDWVWADADRAERLCAIYNRIFNTTVPRVYDGSHMTFPGMNQKYEFRDVQRRAIWRGCVAGNSYFGHAVGTGKTLEACALAITERRLGMVTRPTFVVPGHVLAQFASEYLDAFPGANLLVADEEAFSARKRHEFFGKIQSSPWDGIILTREAFGKIPLSPDTRKRFVTEEIEKLKEWLATKDDGRSAKQVKKIAKQVERLQRKLTALTQQGRKDSAVYFEDLGIDRLIVDEAHGYRKLDFVTEKRNLRGVDPNGSARALDLYMKVRYLESVRPGRSLVMMSGTPITNTLGEMYTIFRFLAPHILTRQGTESFDQWAAVFGETVTGLEVTPSGGYAPVTRFSRFTNLPELINAFREVVDVVRPKDLRGVVKLPVVKTGGLQVIVAERSDAMKSYQRGLQARLEAIAQRSGRPKPGDDIILNVITDGIFATIDERFFAPHLPPNYDNKLNRAIQKAAEIYHATSANEYKLADGSVSPIRGATQMMFLDRRKRANNPFDAYVWMRDELVRMGVPRQEIAFATDYSRDEKKTLIDAFNAGRIRILIGSTAAMGEGTNGQQRLIAEHNLDAPWFPAAVEQRVGRIVRQGNQNPEVDVFAFATSGSFDISCWGILEGKAKFVDQALSEGTSIRSADDLDGSSDQYAIAKAMATDDPRIMQKVGLEQDIRRLERMAAGHHSQQMGLRSEKRNCLASIEHADGKLPLWDKIIAMRESSEPIIRIGNEAASDVETAAASLQRVAWGLHRSDRRSDAYKVGTIGPFAIRVWIGDRIGDGRTKDRPSVWIDFGSGLQGPEIRPMVDDHSGGQLMHRLQLQLKSYPEEQKASLVAQRKRAESELQVVEASLGAPFRYAEELATKQAQLLAIDTALLEESKAMRGSAEANAAGSDDGVPEADSMLDSILDGARDLGGEDDDDDDGYDQAAGM